MQGASPLASPGLGGMRHWVCLWKAGYGGGAYILCRLPTPPCRYPEGAFLLGCLPPLPFAYFAAPLPRRGRIDPRPPSRREGGDQGYFRQGAEPGRHRLSLPSRYPVQGEPEVRRKNDRTAFLLAVPAAKERGDRGRWNYPSHATAAFEMVLSPGAGRTSAAGGLTFLVACLPCL